MHYTLIDNSSHNFLPLTYTRTVSDLLIGVWTIREKWEYLLKTDLTCLKERSVMQENKEETVFIKGNIYPNAQLMKAVKDLALNEVLFDDDEWIATYTDKENVAEFIEASKKESPINYRGKCLKIKQIWDIFQLSDSAIRDDFSLISRIKTSEAIPENCNVIGNNIFIDEGAEISAATINTETGPVYIGKDSKIMEGALIRGPFSLRTGSTVKMGAKIYGSTSIGRHCKVGGEIVNSTIFDFSNKGHDGFLGNSVIGSWCNLGADTNTSNLKNNYNKIRFWNYEEKEMLESNELFLGTIMGDYSKTSINTMLNTGTSVGVCTNIFGSGFPPKFIPSFAWGGKHGFEEYDIEKAFQAINNMMQRRNKSLTEKDENVLKAIYAQTAIDRKGDK